MSILTKREVRSILFSTTPVKIKISVAVVVRTAYDHQPLRLSSLQVTNLNNVPNLNNVYREYRHKAL